MTEKCIVPDCNQLQEILVNKEGDLQYHYECKKGVGGGISRNKRANGDCIAIGKGFEVCKEKLCWYHRRIFLGEISPLYSGTYADVKRAVLFHFKREL